MKRLTERIVSSGRVGAVSFAERPTTTAPPGRMATADGRRRSPVSGSARIRGAPSSRTATRLLVVPRSMPTIRGIIWATLVPDRLVHVPVERLQVRDRREPASELVERRSLPVVETRLELAAKRAEPRRESVTNVAQLGPQRNRAGAGGTQLGEPLLGLEHLGRDLGRHAGAVLGQPLAM